MTMEDIVIGLSIVVGFFVAAAVSRIFRRTVTGILVGGVVGLGVSVAALFYGMDTLFASPDAPPEITTLEDAISDVPDEETPSVTSDDTTTVPVDE